MLAAIPESSIVSIWQQGLTGRDDLVTEDGGLVRIIYPGRINDDRGADLRDAVMMTRWGVIRGDVEVHVQSSSWWGHGHHLDPSYNRVVLHVVYQHDTVIPARLENGTLVPTLALQRFVKRPVSWRPLTRINLPCRRGRRRDEGLVRRVLESAGDERFREKAARFREEIRHEGAGQTLYRGIMTALGYAHNREPMSELARRVPLERLESFFEESGNEAECLAVVRGYLLGMAGLLPRQRGVSPGSGKRTGCWTEKAEHIRRTIGEEEPMSAGDWSFFKVRPGNYPDRRIAAMGYILVRYREKGLLPGLVSVLEGAEDGRRRCLEGALCVGGETGLESGGVSPALLGKERAAEIIVNVLLPFMHALGVAEGRPDITEKAGHFYRLYPATAGNTMERHMKRQLGLGRGVVDRACLQQGLLHIYRKYCSQGGCDGCPLR